MKKIFLRSKVPFVLSIITFLTGCFFVFLSRIDPWSIRWIIILLGFIPCILFVIITILMNVLYEKKYTENICLVFSAIIVRGLLGYYFFIIFMGSVYESENLVMNLKHYKSIVKGDYMLSVFPKEIPGCVEDVSFVYAPGFMQGDTGISLYYKDESLSIEDVDKKFGETAVRVGNFKELSNDSLFEELSFKDIPVEEKERDNFKIYMMNSKCDESGYCNHGKYLFVAFNEKTKEIFYKYCYW